MFNTSMFLAYLLLGCISFGMGKPLPALFIPGPSSKKVFITAITTGLSFWSIGYFRSMQA